MKIRPAEVSKRLAVAAAVAASYVMACGEARAGATSLAPDSIVSALQAAGYKAKLSKGKDGDPVIATAAGGNDITLSFAGCAKGKDCDQIEFLAIWNCAEDVPKCSQMSLKWNESENFSHSLVTATTIALYYHLLMDKDGISPQLFVTNFEYFARDASNLMSLYSDPKGK